MNNVVARTEIDVDAYGEIVGGRITFRSLADVSVNTALHEFTHAAGAHHAARRDFIMYPFVTSLTGYAADELTTLTELMAFDPGGVCTTSSSELFRQMACGDDSAGLRNPGLGQVIRLVGNVNMEVDSSLADKMSVFQDAQKSWLGGRSFTLTVIPASAHSLAGVTKASGTNQPGVVRSVVIFD